jgi:hypothetical protein
VLSAALDESSPSEVVRIDLAERRMTERVCGRDVFSRDGLVIAQEVLNHDVQIVEEFLGEQLD